MLITNYKVIFLFFTLILASCKSNLETKVFELSDSSYSTIKLSNHSNQSNTFYLNLNEAFPLSKTKIINHIYELSVTYDLTIPIAAWKYVAEMTSNTIPISPENWIHDPIIYLNSIGEGFCDDQAAVLAIIWEWLGYQSRVWELNGHVVPEIKYKGKWHMLDPDYEIFYLNNEKEIASVEELSSDMSLITEPKSTSPIIEMLNTKLSPNSEEFLVKNSYYMSNLYTSKEDNKLSPFSTNINTRMHNLSFVLPAKSKIELPVAYEYGFKSNYIRSTALKITLYQNDQVSKLKIPLVLLSDDETKILNSFNSNYQPKKLKPLSDNINSFNVKQSYKNIEDSVVLYYALNPKLFHFNNDASKVILKGKNLKELNFSVNYNSKLIPILGIDTCMTVILEREREREREREMNDEFLIELYLQFVEYLYTCYGECFINRTKNMAYFLNVMKEINGASDTFKCYHFTDESLNSFIKAVYRSQPDKLREIANETSMHYLKN